MVLVYTLFTGPNEYFIRRLNPVPDIESYTGDVGKLGMK